jgi:hypothetical protein
VSRRAFALGVACGVAVSAAALTVLVKYVERETSKELAEFAIHLRGINERLARGEAKP